MRASILVFLALAACSGGGNDLVEDAGDAQACSQATVIFVMKGASGDATRWCIGSDCSQEWLTIVDPSGVEHALGRPCLADCDTCAPYACTAACPAPLPLPIYGVQRSWSGEYFVSGSCGASACTSSVCAPSGRYVAKMCVHRDLDPGAPFCNSSATPTCALVPFDWPPPAGVTEITGTVGAEADAGTDAGACCPSTWPMIDCTFSDGTAGFDCHDPALGCASSQTCGGGCDFVVSGRCDAP